MAVAKNSTSRIRGIIDCQKSVPGDEPATRIGGTTEPTRGRHRAGGADVQKSAQQGSCQRPTDKRNAGRLDLCSLSINRCASLFERDRASIGAEQQTSSALLSSSRAISRRDHSYC